MIRVLIARKRILNINSIKKALMRVLIARKGFLILIVAKKALIRVLINRYSKRKRKNCIAVVVLEGCFGLGPPRVTIRE